MLPCPEAVLWPLDVQTAGRAIRQRIAAAKTWARQAKLSKKAQNWKKVAIFSAAAACLYGKIVEIANNYHMIKLYPGANSAITRAILASRWEIDSSLRAESLQEAAEFTESNAEWARRMANEAIFPGMPMPDCDGNYFENYAYDFDFNFIP